MQRHKAGDPTAARDLNRLSRIERKSSLDLLGSYENLNLDFLTMGGGSSNPGTPALGAFTPKWGASTGGDIFSFEAEGGFEFAMDGDNDLNWQHSACSRQPGRTVYRRWGQKTLAALFCRSELDFSQFLNDGPSSTGMRLHRDSISAMEEFHLDDNMSTPHNGPSSIGIGFSNSGHMGFGLNYTGPDGRVRSFSRGRLGSFSRSHAGSFSIPRDRAGSFSVPPTKKGSSSGTSKSSTSRKTKTTSARSKASSKVKKSSGTTRKRTAASSRSKASVSSSKTKAKSKSSPIGIPTGKAKPKSGGSRSSSAAHKARLKNTVPDVPKPSGDAEYDTGERPVGAPPQNVGAYSPESRRARIAKFLDKRQHRIWKKRVKYDVRKNFADSRLRVKGRFVKKEDEELLRDLMNMI